MQLNNWQKEIEDFRNVQKLPALELLIHANGKEVVHSSTGYFHIKKKYPLPNNCVFNVASITKILTTLAVYHIVNKGFLRLDQKIFDHISFVLPSEADVRMKEITYEQLIFHESGLGFGFPNYKEGPLTLPYLFENPLLQEPGIGFKYSNLGFLLLGFAIEHLVGIPYAAYIRQHFLIPLEMNNSGFSSESYHKKNCAIAYRATDIFRDVKSLNDFNQCPELRMADPSSGLYSTSEDLLKLMRFLQGHHNSWVMPDVQGVPLPKVFFDKNENRNYMRFLYGPGFFYTKSANRDVAFVSGFSIGNSSLVCIVPDLDITLIAMTNQSFAQSQLTTLGMGLITSFITQNEWKFRHISKRSYKVYAAYEYYYFQNNKIQFLIWEGNSPGIYIYRQGVSIKLELIDHDIAINEEQFLMLFLEIKQNKIVSFYINGDHYQGRQDEVVSYCVCPYYHLTGIYENKFFGKIWIQVKEDTLNCIQGNQRSQLIHQSGLKFRMNGSLFFNQEFLTFINTDANGRPNIVRFSGLDFIRIS